MCGEVGRRHLTAGDERRIPGHEPHRDEQPTHEFDDSGQSEEGQQGSGGASLIDPAEHSEQLLGPVTREQEADHDAHHGIDVRRVRSEKSLHGSPLYAWGFTSRMKRSITSIIPATSAFGMSKVSQSQSRSRARFTSAATWSALPSYGARSAPGRLGAEAERIPRGEAHGALRPAGPGRQLAHRRHALLEVDPAEAERMPGIAMDGGPPHGRSGERARRAARPHRWMRLLGRARRERRPAEREIAAGIARLVGRPRGLDDREVLVGHRAALRERQPQVLELGLVPADADAEDEAAARDLVDRGRGLRGDERIAIRQHDHARAHLDPVRPPGEEGEERERVGPGRPVVLRGGRLGHDVVGDEDAVPAELLRAQGHPLGLSRGQAPDGKHHAELHGPLSFGCTSGCTSRSSISAGSVGPSGHGAVPADLPSR